MDKIFLVKKGTNVEMEVNHLVRLGYRYTPTFEEKIGIDDFCMDLEVISDGLIDPNLYLVIAGFSKDLNYQNNDLQEITVDQLRSSFTQGYSIACSGTNRLLENIGYSITYFNEYLNEIKLAQ